MKPLVLVHGFMGGAAQWDGALDLIMQQREVIAVDLPGFGENADLTPLDTIAAFADWVLSYLFKKKIDDFHLLGHSMGGMIAQEMVRKSSARVDKLILYATGSIGELPGRFETIEQSKQRAIADGPKATARRISATWFLNGDAADGYAPCAAIAEKSSSAAIQAGLSAMAGWSGVQNLGAILQNTLVLWGDQDRTYPWYQIERLWRSIPDSRLAVVPDCAHAVHAENPEIFQRIITGFLKT